MKFLKSIIFVLLVLFSVLFIAQANSTETKFAITGHEMKSYKSDCLYAYKESLGDIGGIELFPKLYDIPSTICKDQKIMDMRPNHVYVVRFKIENTLKNSKDGIMVMYKPHQGELYVFAHQLFRLDGDDPYCYLILDAGDRKPEENEITIGVRIRNTDDVITEEYMLTLPVLKEREV